MIAIVNPTTQQDLLDLMGPEEFRELLLEARVQFGEQAAALGAALSCQNWVISRSLAHKMKGSMGSLGYDALFHAMNELEARLREPNQSPPDSTEVAALQNVIEQTRQALLAV